MKQSRKEIKIMENKDFIFINFKKFKYSSLKFDIDPLQNLGNILQLLEIEKIKSTIIINNNIVYNFDHPNYGFSFRIHTHIKENLFTIYYNCGILTNCLLQNFNPLNKNELDAYKLEFL